MDGYFNFPFFLFFFFFFLWGGGGVGEINDQNAHSVESDLDSYCPQKVAGLSLTARRLN